MVICPISNIISTGIFSEECAQFYETVKGSLQKHKMSVQLNPISV
jgi:hypothetical protein